MFYAIIIIFIFLFFFFLGGGGEIHAQAFAAFDAIFIKIDSGYVLLFSIFVCTTELF